MGRKKTFSVVEPSPGKFYICTYENRKRVYVDPRPSSPVSYYASRSKAERDAQRLARRADATDYRELSPLQRREYWELVALARDHGLEIREAVEKGCGRSTSWPERIADHVGPFLEYCSAVRQLRQGSVDFYRHKLAVLFRDFPQATFGDFPAHRLKERIKAAGNGVEWERGAVRAVSAFWNWAAKKNPPAAPFGVTRAIDLEHPRRQRAIDFLTVEEAARVLHYASGRWSRVPIALMAFCGIRKSEAERMRWDWINVSERTIHIPEHVSKTPGGRLIETAPPVLWDWIRDAPRSGPEVCAHQLRGQVKAAALACGVPRWPQSALRHTFITYHYAAYKDRDATIAISGHDGDSTTLEQRYRGVAARRGDSLYLPTQERARQYLSLTPELVGAFARDADKRLPQL